jgi:hypothetical protein
VNQEGEVAVFVLLCTEVEDEGVSGLGPGWAPAGPNGPGRLGGSRGGRLADCLHPFFFIQKLFPNLYAGYAKLV